MQHNRRWSIRQMPGGIWRLVHPYGIAQHLSRDWIVAKAEEIWADVYKKREA